MSFQFNSDRETIQGVNPSIIGSTQFTIRSGSGANEAEIFRALRNTDNLTRIGINRTGRRIDKITIVNSGFGYTTEPTVQIDPPDQTDGIQAEASAVIQDGIIISVQVTEPGDGYTFAPQVSLQGGGGSAGVLTASIDSIDFELDINGAIRTSTSIISDTAKVLNLDVDNFATPDTKFRAPHLKTYLNGGGVQWSSVPVILNEGEFRYYGFNLYKVIEGGLTGTIPPTHNDGEAYNGDALFKHVGFRVDDPTASFYEELPNEGLFPRSVTPALGDRSDKIATTEYVLNLATNDVGGRIYVSEQIGDDLNNGRSAAQPVRTIKRAAQLAWATPGVKETLIVSGGDYREDNPISLPPDASVVGDNLRLVIVRPNNPGKHIFKFGDKNYVIGLTYRDKLDVNGLPESTWDFAMVFDDKQRITYDNSVNGDFGVSFPIGHQIFGEQKFTLKFTDNTATVAPALLSANQRIRGVNSTANGLITKVTFDVTDTTAPDVYLTGEIEYDVISGSFSSGELFRFGGSDTTHYVTQTSYTLGQLVWYNQNVYEVTAAGTSNDDFPTHDGTGGTNLVETLGTLELTWNRPAKTFISQDIKSIRAEGEVVFEDTDNTSFLPIAKIVGSLQGDPSIATGGFQDDIYGNAEDLGGIIFYTNNLIGSQNIHDFKEGQEIIIEGLPTSNPDMSALNGRQRIYKVLEDADGRSRRFVIPKKMPALASYTEASPYEPGATAKVKNASASVTLSLLNSPNKFGEAQPLARRYQDASQLIKNNIDFIADEVVGRINDEFKQEYFPVYNIGGPGAVQLTPTNVTYNPATGISIFTVPNHGLSNGDIIRVAENSVYFTCDMDGNRTEHPVPAPGTGASGGVVISNVTTNSFEANVGASGPNVSFTPTTGTSYDPATGDLVLEVGSHSLSVGEGIVIDTESLGFTCDMDSNSVTKFYPRAGHDQFALKSVKITAATPTSFTVNIGASPANKTLTPAVGTTYNAGTGDLVLAVGQHGLKVGQNVTLVDNSLTFTCDQDNDQTPHTYPRPSDPASGASLSITNVGFNSHTIESATYNPATGDVVITITGHGFQNNDYVMVEDGALGFSCVLDGNTVTKYYPRTNIDRASNRWLAISEATLNTFTINIGGSEYTGAHTFVPGSENTNGLRRQDGNLTINVGVGGTASGSVHTFVSATAGAVKFEPQSAHTFVSATAGAVRHEPQSAHTFTRANANAITSGGSELTIYLGTSRFAHTYVSGGNIVRGGSTFPITGFAYDNVNTGEAIITTSANFGALTDDDIVRIEDITVQCVIDGTVTQKTYPSFNIPTNDNKCRRDIGHFLNSLCRDLEYGSNFNVIDTAQKYIDGTGQAIAFVDNEIIQTVRAIEYARELAIFAMRKWRTGTGAPGQPVYTPVYSSLPQYIDDTVINDTATPACANVFNAINTLSYLFVDVLANNTNGTYLDAAYLLARNRHVIAEEAFLETKAQYPSSSLTNVQERKCRRDIDLVLGGIIRDLSLGGNAGVVTAAENYYSGTSLTGIPETQRVETVYAFQRVAIYAQHAVRNWSVNGNVTATTPSSATYNSTSGELTVTFATPATALSIGDRIAFVEGALTFSCNMGNGVANHPSPQKGDANYGKSHVITNVNAAGGTTTITCNVGDGGTSAGVPHIYAGSLANGTILIHDPSSTTSDIPQFEDWNILLDGSNPICAGVITTLQTEFALLEDILDGTVLPGDTTKNTGTLYDTTSIITYPSSYIYDANNVKIAVRATYDDFPIIEASPYTQNASVISFLGGSGALVDGSKVKQPNCPFPGLQPDQSATFPNQGKSMVASAFTIVSFGGTGYKVIEDGYTQLVSVFVIFCADGVLAESGGYCSITNSATNFGTFALRGVGFRDEAYAFDVGTITEVGQTVTGKTTFEVSGLGRKPLEHYIVKIDGIKNTNETIEYFIDSVVGGAAGAPAVITLEGGNGLPTDFTDVSTGNPVSNSSMLSKTIRLHRPSIVNSSSHTWEFAGSGTDYNALPENGGVKVESREQVPQNYGRVYVSGTDELGDFKVGTFAKIENRTGAITFTGTVSISEVEFLKLKGGDVVVTGFSSDNTLGGSQSSNSLISTQKAVRDFIVNNLGLYINKPYSTNPVPRALVELTDAGTINIDQLPPIRPFSVFTVDTEEERLRLEGALAGDIAIQENSVAGGGNGATESFILNNDNDSLFLGFPVDTGLQFSVNSIYTGSVTGGKIQATEYRQGVVFQLNITDGGSGYTAPPVVTISGGNLQSGGEPAVATATISGGQVVTVELYFNNGYTGGKGYTTQPSVQIDAPTNPDGSTATAEALIESRLYGDIVNNIKITDNDTVQDSSASPQTVTLTRVINTSGTSADNWVSLSSNQIAAGDITSGIISTARLANDSAAANSFTFLRGDQSYSEAVQSIKGPEERYFLKTLSSVGSGSSQISVPYSENIIIGHEVDGTGIADDTIIQSFIVSLDGTTITITLDKPTDDTIPADTVINFTRNPSPILLSSNQSEGNFIDSIVIANGGTGCTVDNQPNGIARNVSLGGGAGTGLTANITVTSGVVTSVVVVDPGSGYSNDFVVTPFPPELGSGSFLVLQAKKSTTNRMYANTTIDVARVTDGTTDDYGTLGLARFAKAQFEIGLAGDGSVRLKTGDASNLDADRLDGFEGSYYLNASNLAEGTIGTNRLSGTYNIGISGQAGSARRLYWQETAVNSPVTPSEIPEGITITPKNDGVNGLSDCPDPVNDPKPYLLVNIRASETNGGSRQLAFTDGPGDDSGGGFWFRGSNDTLSQFKNWYKVWTSGSDGPESGLDADKLESREGIWYQNSLNQTSGYLRDGRIPKFQTSKSFLDEVCVYDWSAAVYQFYVNVDVNTTTLGIVTATPFLVGDTITVFDATGGNLGTAVIKNVFSNIDGNDSQNNYLIVTATYNSGSNPDTNWKNLGKTIGGTNNGGVEVKVAYQDFDISNYDADANNIVDGAFTISKLKSDNGTALLEMGRVTGSNSTTPAIRLFTEGSANWQSAIVASGNGQTAQQSGNLEFLVNDVNSVKVNANVLWNAGNVTITSTNSGSTYTNNNADFDAANPENNLVLRNVVMRDKDGNFSAGTITADLDGSASGNLSSDGGTITGNLEIANGFGLTLAGGNLGVNGTIIGSDDFKIDTTNNLFIVDVSEGKVGVSKSPTSDDGKFTIYGQGRNDLTIRTPDNVADQGIAYQNSGGAYTWNLMRADVGSNRADFIILGNSTSGPETNINSLNDYFRIRAGGDVKINQRLGIGRNPTDKFDVDGNVRTDKLIVKADGSNPGAVVELISSGTGGNARNFRLNAATDDIFRIQSSSSDGGTTFNSTGAININANNNRVGIDIDPSTASTDNAGDAITGGGYQLYVNGSLNVQGTVYQNGLPFSGSNWTLSGSNIYRNTTVAIGTNSISTSGATNQKLQVNGGISMNGSLVVNGNYLWIDNNAVIRTSLDTISQNITIDAGISASSTGPITVSSGTTITVNGSWAIQ